MAEIKLLQKQTHTHRLVMKIRPEKYRQFKVALAIEGLTIQAFFDQCIDQILTVKKVK